MVFLCFSVSPEAKGIVSGAAGPNAEAITSLNANSQRDFEASARFFQ